jgi:hypothetical protein
MKRTKKTLTSTQSCAQRTGKLKRVRVGKLQTMPEVAGFQARMIKKALRDGGVSVNDGYKLVMMASMLAKTLEATDLEKRIAALEQKYKAIIA